MQQANADDKDSDAITRARELNVFTSVINALNRLDDRGKIKMLRTVATFLDIETEPPRERKGPDRAEGAQQTVETPVAPKASFTEDRAPTPKQFLFEKAPITEVERVACLGYFLAHYRQMPHFKTFDISQLNTDAAQTKFSNPARAVDHATQAGLLAQAGGGKKQISSTGELYVQALPDREAAKQVALSGRARRNRGKVKVARAKKQPTTTMDSKVAKGA